MHDHVEPKNLDEWYKSPTHNLDNDAWRNFFHRLLFLLMAAQDEKNSHCSSKNNNRFPQCVKAPVICKNCGDHIRHRGFLKAVLNVPRGYMNGRCRLRVTHGVKVYSYLIEKSKIR